MKTLLIFLMLLIGVSARADLAAVVTPGYTYGPGDRPNIGTLNRLGQPTITIVGTIGGTNAGLAAESIDGTQLKSAVVDGTNITWNSAGPRQLKIVDGGVGITQIGSAIAGFGLLGGSGAALRANVDSNTITSGVDGDTITLGTNLSPSRVKWTTNSFLGASPYFTNSPVTLPAGWYVSTNNALVATVATKYAGTNTYPAAGGTATYTHGLSGLPQLVRLTAVCTNTERGYVAGDIIDAISLGSASAEEQFSLSWDATTVTVTANSSSTVYIINKSTGNRETITRANFLLRVDAVILP